jgi:hypothetical protein
VTNSGDQTPETLTAFQVEVARLFFSLPAADGFLLTGGAALVAHHLTVRPTQDLDFLTTRDESVTEARDAFQKVAEARGWSVTRLQDVPSFCRMEVQGPEGLLVDLVVDAPPNQPTTVTVLGPTLAPEDLAGRKLLALFDRAAARDFVDVFELCQRYDPELLITWAAAVGLGFDRVVLAEQMTMLDRYTDADLPCPPESADAVRAHFRAWRTTLAQG